MNREALRRSKKWFADYVADYYRDDTEYNRAIWLKEEHTRRVCRNIVMVGGALGLSEKDLMLAEAMALFHDVGRFKQYATYGTFSDRASENHAKLGVRQICLHDALSACTQGEKRLIASAIAYHNAAMLPVAVDERTRLFMRLLRDADKLDIWRVFAEYYPERREHPNKTIELDLPDHPGCSPRILAALHNGRIADIKDLKTLNDFKLLQISWVFDLNFVPSFQLLRERRCLEEIAATLPQSRKIQNAIQPTYNYMDSVLRGEIIPN